MGKERGKKKRREGNWLTCKVNLKSIVYILKKNKATELQLTYLVDNNI